MPAPVSEGHASKTPSREESPLYHPHYLSLDISGNIHLYKLSFYSIRLMGLP